MDRSLIDRYLAQADLPARAVQGLTPAELTSFPVPGKWSIHQLVVHLMDSDLIASDRMKRIAAMDNPLLIGYDESAFMNRLDIHAVPIKDACDAFAANRRATGAVLRKLPDEAFARTGVHNERGKLSLEDLIRGYVEHVDHHMRFLHDKRKALGKPLAT